MYNSLLVRFFIFFFLISLSAKATEYSFKGNLRLQQQSLPFELHFNIASNNLVTGYSITAKETADETKTRIKGRWNKKNQTIFFYETVVLQTKAKNENLDFCLLTGTLNWKSNKLSGNFLGFSRGTKNKCARGRIVLNGSKRFKKVAVAPKSTVKPIIKKKKIDTLVSNIASKKIINHHTNAKQLTLQLWDDYNADGDVLSVYLNGKIILDHYRLEKKKKVLDIVLDVKRSNNIIKLKAISEGKAPPNTARLSLIDNEKVRELITHIKKGQEVFVRIN